MLLTAMATAVMFAAPTADSATQRQAFVTCLRGAVTKAQSDKIKPADFDAAARQSCAAQISDFKSALVAWDVKTGSPRRRAESDADAQIGDYMTSSAEKLDPGS